MNAPSKNAISYQIDISTLSYYYAWIYDDELEGIEVYATRPIDDWVFIPKAQLSESVAENVLNTARELSQRKRNE